MSNQTGRAVIKSIRDLLGESGNDHHSKEKREEAYRLALGHTMVLIAESLLVIAETMDFEHRNRL